jgi:hypothetical protein
MLHVIPTPDSRLPTPNSAQRKNGTDLANPSSLITYFYFIKSNMKKILFLMSMIVSVAVFAQGPSDITFTTKTHQFGKIKQKVPATYVFAFTNKGAKPAIIEFANADCGCTTPVYSNEPILKGKTSTIKVTYNAEAIGTFKKNVNVKFLDAQLPVVLTIEGEVVASAAAPKAKAKTK